MKNKIVMVGLTSLFLTFNAVAAEYQLNGLSLNASLGVLSGKAHEYVYYPHRESQLSQLDWRIKNAALLNGELNYDVLSWLSLNGRGWTTLAKNKAAMDDYDWFNPYQEDWTHWSHHENTHLNYANGLDLSLRAWLMQNQNYKLGLAAGYQWDAFSWRALGGCYEYNNGMNIGCFPDNFPGIGYQQKFRTPYVGLAGKYFINNFEFNALLKYSNWVSARDHDEHYARQLTFKDQGNHFGYYAATLNAGYFVTRGAKIFVEGSYNHFSNGHADTEIINKFSGAHGYESDSAGLSNKNYSLALGMQYTF
ncbi:omptin family outer membrane protease [Fluoribacter dumoffii]|uniref:omptin family outer membrane protease n=1 Tax=Fluoribacter dumoffii TaxID=463 RepID=UPI00026C7773|nr:omptin family outer membrane protease [Fluoribacter dumoffii]MCW8386929.1 omptin family outer membrane protease [Fluoribacter dumoffii]MCW8417567.1 omptin family outer membrane protease [Fluoribacter dumoffii]MCW8454592.1 omptin family outer membrane protease [Fluoribacter dumoffii]MCW8461332.1 omptin family outer membrane protease [Fluoribacter dumoffii]MCW8484773.1 omptin family outer membrane protease [Fluoribacter dumoffii]